MKITDTGDAILVMGATPEEKKRFLSMVNKTEEKPSKPKLITRKQAAEILGTCPETIKRYVKRGLIRQINFTCRQVRYDEPEIIEFARIGDVASRGGE
ncbi:MAG: helix-turn-helix domain-containing protein [Kiritimatiellales bacterium]